MGAFTRKPPSFLCGSLVVLVFFQANADIKVIANTTADFVLNSAFHTCGKDENCPHFRFVIVSDKLARPVNIHSP